MTVNELAAVKGFNAVSLPEGDREISGVYIGDLLSWVMGRAKAGDAWITIMSNINIVAVASLADVACIISPRELRLTGRSRRPPVSRASTSSRPSLPLTRLQCCSAKS